MKVPGSEGGYMDYARQSQILWPGVEEGEGRGGVIVYPGNSLVWAAPRVRGVIEL